MARQPKPWRRQARAAFTLIELLVVIAIIMLLAALLLPALKQARDRARVATCQSNQRQTGITLLTYGMDFGEYATATTWANGVAAWSSYPESIGDGQPAFQLMLSLHYVSNSKVLQCTTTQPVRDATSFDEFESQAWFRYNGPSLDGTWGAQYGHGSTFMYYGWNWPDYSNWFNSSHGASLRDPSTPRAGYNWYDFQALTCCPRSIICDPLWVYCRAYEPHGTNPQSAANGSEVQASDYANQIHFRNYSFTDGHVELLHK